MKYSKGMKQRLLLCIALMNNPKILFLDEPTSGLDPNQIRTVRQTITELARDRTVLLSTHILQEVEAVADRVIFINEGRLVFDGSLDELKSKADNLDDVFHAYTLGDGAEPVAAGQTSEE